MNTMPMALAVLALSAFAASAPAQTENAGPAYTVPLDLKNLHPAITRGRVACYVSPEVSGSASDTVAMGTTEFAVVNQAYKADVVVRTVYQPGKTSAQAKRWACRAEALVAGQWQLLGGNQNRPETNAANAPNGYAPATVSGVY